MRKHWIKTWDNRNWERWHKVASSEKSTEKQRARAKARYERSVKWGMAWAFLTGKL